MGTSERDSTDCTEACAHPPDAVAVRINGEIYTWTNPNLTGQEAIRAKAAVVAAAKRGGGRGGLPA